MFHRYFSALKSKPIRTNLATSIVVTLFGDVGAQTIELRQRDFALGNEKKSYGGYLERIDWKRSAMVTGYWALTVPLTLPWFRWLDKTFVVSQTRAGLVTLVKKIGFHMFTYAPTVNAFFYGWLILCRNPDKDGSTLLREWGEKLENDLVETHTTCVKFWSVAHVFNFLFLPNHTRVLFNSVFLVFWTGYVSLVVHREIEAPKEFSYDEKELVAIEASVVSS